MSLFRRVHDAVRDVVNDAGRELARIDPGPAVANLVSQVGDAGMNAIQNQANNLAQAAKDSGTAADNQSCRIIVITGIAAWAATQPPPVSVAQAALTAGGGAAVAQLACDRVFPPG
jgi:hypothetical protein